jgi:hypothetical protein
VLRLLLRLPVRVRAYDRVGDVCVVRPDDEYTERVPESPTKPVIAPRIPPPPTPEPLLEYDQPETADLLGLLERVRVCVCVCVYVVREGEGDERRCAPCVWLPLPKLQAEISDLEASLRVAEPEPVVEPEPRMLRVKGRAPGMASAVLTVGGFVGGRERGSDAVRVCRDSWIGGGMGKGDDGRAAARSSYIAMSSPARRRVVPVVLVLPVRYVDVGWELEYSWEEDSVEGKELDVVCWVGVLWERSE